MFKIRKIFLQCVIVLMLLCTVFVFAKDTISANTSGHTAMITEKSAVWTNEEEYLADLTLKVNGSQIAKSQDVVFVLDRSGSMDMEYIQEGGSYNGTTDSRVGSHIASSPCLHPDHFYFKEKAGVDAEALSSVDQMKYDDVKQELTVYNGEQEKWVVLDTSEKVHLYHLFTQETYAYGAYHFCEDTTNPDMPYHRISKWDTTDIRSGINAGLWDHADEAEGCYDRWIESKKAVKEFASTLLSMNETYGLNNSISLVPFSARDQTMHSFLNKSKTLQKEYLINQKNSEKNMV